MLSVDGRYWRGWEHGFILGHVDAHKRKIIEGIIEISTIGNIELFNNQQGSKKKKYIYI